LSGIVLKGLERRVVGHEAEGILLDVALRGGKIRNIDFLKVLLQQPIPEEINQMMGSPSATLERRVPHLHDEFSVIIHETNMLALTKIRDNYLNTMMTGLGVAELRNAVTGFGQELLSFVSEGE
jgi:hypothetical protein